MRHYLSNRICIYYYGAGRWQLHVRVPGSYGLGRPCLYNSIATDKGWYFLPRDAASCLAPGAIPVAPPSERLEALVAAFAHTQHEMALIDALIEEYPDLEPHLAGVLNDRPPSPDR